MAASGLQLRFTCSYCNHVLYLALFVRTGFVVQVLALACCIVAGDANAVVERALVAAGAGAVVGLVLGSFLFFSLFGWPFSSSTFLRLASSSGSTALLSGLDAPLAACAAAAVSDAGLPANGIKRAAAGRLRCLYLGCRQRRAVAVLNGAGCVLHFHCMPATAEEGRVSMTPPASSEVTSRDGSRRTYFMLCR